MLEIDNELVQTFSDNYCSTTTFQKMSLTLQSLQRTKSVFFAEPGVIYHPICSIVSSSLELKVSTLQVLLRW